MVDSAARGRLGRAAIALAALAVVLPLARSASTATVDVVLPTPPLGAVRAEVLPNGTPVFAVHGPDGQLDVIQAFTTGVEGPVTALVGWCAAAQVLVDPHHGPLYDRRGRRLPNSLAGRLPAEDVYDERRTGVEDLVHREVARVEGRTGEDDPVVIGGIQQLQPWQVARRPDLDPVAPPAACRLGGGPEGARMRVLDHGFLAGPVDAGAGGWQITDGWLAVAADGTATWCDAEPQPHPPALTCPAPRDDVAVGFRLPAGAPAVLGGPLAARLDEGVVQRVAVLPRSTWRGVGGG